jgi:branched-chain amino acid transport system substrate-binding protein
MDRKRFWSVLLGALFVMGACSSGTATPSPTSKASAAPPASSSAPPAGTASPSGPSSYKFAVIGPFSGDNAALGDQLQKGIKLSVDKINAAGGINGKPVELELDDTQCLATGAATAASKIASDPSVFAVIGDVCSSATLAALPILARAGITEVSGDSTSPKITQVVKANHYTNWARVIPSDDVVAQQTVKLPVGFLKLTKIGVLYANDAFGQGMWAFQQPELQTVGATLTDVETYIEATTKDFTPQLSKLAASHPQALLMTGNFDAAGTAVSQMARAGLTGVQIVGSAGLDQQGFINIGGSALEGALVFSYYNKDNPSPANQAFVKAFTAAYGVDPAEYGAYGYEIPGIYKQAIEAGATRDTLGQVLRTMTFTGPTGTTKFDANGDVLGKGAVVLKVTSGKYVVDTEATAFLAQ